jgi:hypothetical protein
VNILKGEMAHLGSGRLQNPHCFTRLDQLIDQVRSNKPAASGNQNQRLPPIPSVLASSARIWPLGERFWSFIVFTNSRTAVLIGQAMPRARRFK